MRGTAWVNTFQTCLFLLFGAIAVAVIGAGMGGFGPAMEIAARVPRHRAAPDARADLAALLLQLHVHPAVVDRLSAHRHLLPDGAGVSRHFKKTVVLYPLCMIAIWLPSVFLGVAANAARDVPAIQAKLEAQERPGLRGTRRCPAGARPAPRRAPRATT